MEYTIEATSKLTMINHEQEGYSELKGTLIKVTFSNNIDTSKLFDGDKITKKYVESLTYAFTHGLSANLHTAHQQGVWDSAEHLRFIITELEKCFVQVAEAKVLVKPNNNNNNDSIEPSAN